MKRRSPLSRTSGLKRSQPMRRKRRRARKPADRDDAYLTWCRRQSCAMCSRLPAGSAHHPRRDVGLALKSPDRKAFPLCDITCHTPGLHKLAGPFKGWTRERLQAWEEEMSARFRALYERQRAA